MSDPYLSAHEVVPGVFLLAGLRPASIRDQVLRAINVVDRLVCTGRLTAGRSLAVVGAGAAGVAAAMQAVRRGTAVTMLDAGRIPFALQFGNQSRFIHPTQYDWPCDHAGGPAIPLSAGSPVSPLPLVPDTPLNLALGWTAALSACIVAHPRLLRIIARAQVATPALSGGRVLMAWTGPNTGSGLFDEVIWAAGMADEETRVFGPTRSLVYEGPKFWTTDRLQRLAGPGNFIVVSGGGDGALQDYLRVAFRRERFDHLISSLPVPPKALALVQSAEDRGARSAAWERSGRGGAIAATRRLAELAAAIGRAATLSLADPRFVASLTYELRGPQARFALVHRAPHLSAIYPLNRFLVEVVRRHLVTHGLDTVFPGEEIVDVKRISGPGGSPTGSPPLHPSAALGAWHRVSFSNASGALPRDLDVNAILVRHGPRAPSTPIPHPGVLGQPCQVLPYGV